MHLTSTLINHKNVEVYTFLNDLNNVYAKAYNNVKFSQGKRYKHFQKNAKLRTILLNDIAYLKSGDKSKYVGPFIVILKHSPVSFSIRRLHYPDNCGFRVHIDRFLLAPPRNDSLIADLNNDSFKNFLNKESL